MRFSAVSAVLAFVGTALAQTAGFDPITSPGNFEEVPAGQTYTIKWQSTREGKISLALIGGESQATLVALGSIATGVESSAGQYPWAVDASLGAAKIYGIQLTLESNTTIFQYSFPFTIKGSGSSSSASGSASGYPSTVSTVSTTKSASASGYPTTSRIPTSYSTLIPSGNLSTTAVPSSKTTVGTTITTTAATTTTASRSSTAASTIPSAAAPHVAAGSLALVGGIAAAIFAL